ncbi:MAG: metal ABC transporter ATP-binding protein [Candidatus Atribacteria bacterium]|nr:metal ABC transporter ATP-binding protein [Candidatus Atribacteria bacterium]
MNEMTPIISLKQVSFSYHDLEVLEEASLDVSTGEFLAIIGPNGAGKTTLLRIILGLLLPTEGEVTVFGKKPTELGPLRSRIGYVPQINRIDYSFPIQVRDFVMTGRFALIGPGHFPGREDHDSAKHALELTGIQNFQNKQIGKLSGGQRQKALIARALVNKPDLLILDEPTTAVDPQSTESLYELLLTLHQRHMTILTVSHDVGVVAQYADSIACVNRKVIRHTRPEEVISEGVLDAMYGKEAAFFHHGRIPHIVVRESSSSRVCPSSEEKKTP